MVANAHANTPHDALRSNILAGGTARDALQPEDLKAILHQGRTGLSDQTTAPIGRRQSIEEFDLGRAKRAVIEEIELQTGPPNQCASLVEHNRPLPKPLEGKFRDPILQFLAGFL